MFFIYFLIRFCILLSLPSYAQIFPPYAKLLGLLGHMFCLGLLGLILCVCARLCVCVCVIRMFLFYLALCFFTITHSPSCTVLLTLLPKKVNYGKVLTAIGVYLSWYNDSRPINGPPSGL